MFNNFFYALKLLTGVPLKINEKVDTEKAIIMFPVTGFFIGMVLYVLNLTLRRFLPEGIKDFIIIFVWFFIAEGIDPKRFSNSMKQITDGFKMKGGIVHIAGHYRIGVNMSVIIIVLLSLKAVAFYRVSFLIKGGVLLAVPVISRAGIVFMNYLLRFTPVQVDNNQQLVQKTDKKELYITGIMAIIVGLLLLWKGIVLLVMMYGFIYTSYLYIKKRKFTVSDGIIMTFCELSEIVGLITIALLH